MFFVFFMLILSTCLIPLILIEIKAKMAENQFDIAIRSIESNLDSIPELRKEYKYRLTRFKMFCANWHKVIKTQIFNGYVWLKQCPKIAKKYYTQFIQLIKTRKFKIKFSRTKN
ncbi:hypothetical protein [Rummeliibacillus sp. SL167]|uniref:hypothetical protein n=1 Tax=Rummeliibacillus sp. SL167 TaxID=2579792 RepID=UPI0011B72326|nr:hypothetical protein [Rummeliibacillus sp. SL167]